MTTARPGVVTAFIAVNVIPMDTERVLANQTVVIEGGRITALGPTGQVVVPGGAVRIDGRGKYLMPGLNDMHAHFNMLFKGKPEQRENTFTRYLFHFLAHGVTGIRNLGGDGKKYRRFESPEILGPRFYLGATTVMRQLGNVAADAAELKAAGYDFIDWRILLPSDPDSTLDAFLKEAYRLGLPSAVHVHGNFDLMLSIGAYGGSFEHMYAFWGGSSSMTSTLSDTSTAALRSLALATKRAGTWITPTLVCIPHRLDLAGPVLRALQEAGVGLLLGLDANLERPVSIAHSELALMVRAGLSPYQALATGTRNVAQYFGKLDSSGTVAVGKRADLVLLYGNPLADIRHTREPAGVMAGGRWLDRAALDQRLLASPKAWFAMEVRNGFFPALRSEQKRALQGHNTAVEGLIDSLAATSPKSPQYEALLQRMAATLGVMRTLLKPEQFVTFDPAVRVWLREQSRQGYRVAVPGVAFEP